MLPVRVGEAQLAGRHALVLERLGDRVDLGDEERAARGQEVGHDLGPAPGCRAASRARRATCRRCRTCRPGSPAGRTGSTGRSARPGTRGRRASARRQLHGGRREVGARHPRAEPREREGVDAEVALEVQERPAGDVADQLELVRRGAGCRPRGTPPGRRSRPRRGCAVQMSHSAWLAAIASSASAVVGRRSRRIAVRPIRATRRTGRPGRRSAARQNATTWPASSRIQGFSSRGSIPSSSSTRSIQRPAMRVDGAVRDPGDGRDPGRVHPLDGACRRPGSAALELQPGVEEVGRLVVAGDGPDGLGEEVQPGGVQAAAERAGGRGTGAGRRARRGRPCR